jgi:hypothetical protein
VYTELYTNAEWAYSPDQQIRSNPHMKRTLAVALTSAALILASGTLPLASAAPAPATLETAVVEVETYPAPAIDRDSYEVAASPEASRFKPCRTPAAPHLPRCHKPKPRPYEGDLVVETCRAALNGYVVCAKN